MTLTDTLPKFYGLPEVHKKDTPLRPIVSLVNSPTYFLAKVIYNELRNTIKTPSSHINNSLELKEKLYKFTIDSDCVLLSLEVSSLFTSIPCSLVLETLDKRYHKIANMCKIPFDEIRNCTKFRFDNNFFIFDHTVYQQIEGTPMGSPISPLFADMFMDDLETNCLKKLKVAHNCIPLFYYRYVDDTILCIKKEHINLVINIFNSYNENFKFTSELENNNSINFLYLTLFRENNKIITNWFKKPSSSDRTIN